MRAARIWGGVAFVLLILQTVAVVWLGYFALVTNGTLCDFKRDLQDRRDGSASFLEKVESGKRSLPVGITLADLHNALAARDATLRSLSDLHCSP